MNIENAYYLDNDELAIVSDSLRAFTSLGVAGLMDHIAEVRLSALALTSRVYDVLIWNLEQNASLRYEFGFSDREIRDAVSFCRRCLFATEQNSKAGNSGRLDS